MKETHNSDRGHKLPSSEFYCLSELCSTLPLFFSCSVVTVDIYNISCPFSHSINVLVFRLCCSMPQSLTLTLKLDGYADCPIGKHTNDQVGGRFVLMIVIHIPVPTPPILSGNRVRICEWSQPRRRHRNRSAFPATAVTRAFILAWPPHSAARCHSQNMTKWTNKSRTSSLKNVRWVYLQLRFFCNFSIDCSIRLLQ